MKGIVFNLFEQCVHADYGEDFWDELLNAAGLVGAYTSLGSYDDAELVLLVREAAAALDKTPIEVERWLGRAAMAPLSQRYPEFFEGHTSAHAFVLTLNDIIHPEVRKLYPGADVPVFDFLDIAGTSLTMLYRSPRRMCAFAEGLLEGAAEYFGEYTEIEQTRCVHRGDDACQLTVDFRRGAVGV